VNLFGLSNGLSTTNYDLTLIGWDDQSVQSGEQVDFGTSVFTLGGSAETARTNLINNDLWTINDGGGV
jgi:hypothetical protein